MKRQNEWFETFDKHLWLKGDEGAEREAAFVKRALRLRRGSRVLDVPCGAGRILVHLAKAGCEATGVDRMPEFVERAKARLKSEGAKGRVLVSDMRTITFDGEFDAVYNWGGSFGYFTDAENVDVLRRFARALRSGGRVLVDQPNREFYLRHWMHERRFERGILKNIWDAQSQRSRSEWALTSGGEGTSLSLMRLYTQGQFRQIFEEAGLVVEAMYGDLDGGEYYRGSKRIHVVGRKAAR